jgi:hypothetical protein
VHLACCESELAETLQELGAALGGLDPGFDVCRLQLRGDVGIHGNLEGLASFDSHMRDITGLPEVDPSPVPPLGLRAAAPLDLPACRAERRREPAGDVKGPPASSAD